MMMLIIPLRKKNCSLQQENCSFFCSIFVSKILHSAVKCSIFAVCSFFVSKILHLLHKYCSNTVGNCSNTAVKTAVLILQYNAVFFHKGRRA